MASDQIWLTNHSVPNLMFNAQFNLSNVVFEKKEKMIINFRQ